MRKLFVFIACLALAVGLMIGDRAYAASDDHDTVAINSGTLNGSSLNANAPEITVSPGESISGSVNITVHNIHSSSAIFPVGWCCLGKVTMLMAIAKLIAMQILETVVTQSASTRQRLQHRGRILLRLQRAPIITQKTFSPANAIKLS